MEYLEIKHIMQQDNIKEKCGLAEDGIIGCNTWRSLQEFVIGTGKTDTTID